MLSTHTLDFFVHLGFELLKLLLVFSLHLFHAGTHVQDSFDTGEIDTQVLHEAANLYNAIDITVRVQAWAVRAITFACRSDKPQAFIVPQRLLMHVRFFSSHADNVPCAVAPLRHGDTPFCQGNLQGGPLCYGWTSTPRLRANFSNMLRSSPVR